jgi:type II secretory pathway pseudopilin PulG
MSQYPSHPSASGGDTNQGAPAIAIVALVCGIVGLCFAPAGLAAVILGIIFLSQTSDGKPGRGMAWAGTIMGIVGVVLSVVVLLIAILLPALGASQRTAHRMQNSTQLRGIHQGMVIFAQSNKGYFPGMNASGDILADGNATGFSGHGNTPQARFWIMLDGDFITPEYLISPSETQAIVEYMGTGPVASDNYSYAQLGYGIAGDARTDPRTGEQSYAVSMDTQGRAMEWRETLNSQAVVLSDRNVGGDASANVQSIHADEPGNWRGSILWNDNHVGFENTHVVETKYGSGSRNLADNLFDDDGTNGYDALMVVE